MSVRLVLTCCASDDDAARLARALVDERLAACVNRLPGVLSTYRWQGETVEEREVMLLIKTTAAAMPALERRVAELHAYALPELLAFDAVDGLAAYLRWVEAEVRVP